MTSGDRVVPELEPCDTRHLQDADWLHLRRLRALVADDTDAAQVAAVLDDIGRGPRNGLVVAIEAEVRGLYGIEPSNRHRYVPKDRFVGLDVSQLRQLVLARVDALRPGPCVVPEAVFRVQVHAVEFEGELVAVREITGKDWDYSLFETTSGPPGHVVEIEYGSHATYSVVKRLAPEDSALLADGTLDAADIDRLVDRYR